MRVCQMFMCVCVVCVWSATPFRANPTLSWNWCHLAISYRDKIQDAFQMNSKSFGADMFSFLSFSSFPFCLSFSVTTFYLWMCAHTRCPDPELKRLDLAGVPPGRMYWTVRVNVTLMWRTCRTEQGLPGLHTLSDTVMRRAESAGQSKVFLDSTRCQLCGVWSLLCGVWSL